MRQNPSRLRLETSKMDWLSPEQTAGVKKYCPPRQLSQWVGFFLSFVIAMSGAVAFAQVTNAPSQPSSDVATIFKTETPGRDSVGTISKVDGIAYTDEKGGPADAVRISPGRHTIEVMCISKLNLARPISEIEVEAGKSYEVGCEVIGAGVYDVVLSPLGDHLRFNMLRVNQPWLIYVNGAPDPYYAPEPPPGTVRLDRLNSPIEDSYLSTCGRTVAAALWAVVGQRPRTNRPLVLRTLVDIDSTGKIFPDGITIQSTSTDPIIDGALKALPATRFHCAPVPAELQSDGAQRFRMTMMFQWAPYLGPDHAFADDSPSPVAVARSALAATAKLPPAAPPTQTLVTILAPPESAGAAIPHEVVGEEFAGLITRLNRYVTVNTTGSNLNITLDQGAVSVVDAKTGGRGFGSYRIDAANSTLCLERMHPDSVVTLDGCYRAAVLANRGVELKSRSNGLKLIAASKEFLPFTLISESSSPLLTQVVSPPAQVAKTTAPRALSDASTLSGSMILQQLARYPEIDAYTDDNQFVHLSLANGTLRFRDSMHSNVAQGFYRVDSATQNICFSGLQTSDSQRFNGCYVVVARDATDFELRRVEGKLSLMYRTLSP